MADAFVAVIKVSEIPSGSVVAVEVGGRPIAIANVDGAFYAFDDTCTHEECSLAMGYLTGTTIACECHGAEFDVRTGEVLAPPAPEPVRVYPTRVEDGSVKIAV